LRAASGRGVGTAAALLVTLAACTTPAPPSSGTPTAPPTAGSPGVAGPSAAGSLSSSIPSGSAVADPSLLSSVAATNAGLTLTYDAETTEGVLRDPTLGTDVAAVATGLAVAPGVSGGTDQFVIVNVVRLRDAALDDSWFRDWRDSYDASACEPAGGVSGHAETKIGDRTVFIGSCAGGAFTYHVRLGDGGLVVSLTSVGPNRLGELLLRTTIAP